MKTKKPRRAPPNFARHLIERDEAERKRVALVIHDRLGHQLLVLKNAAAQALAHSAPDAALRAQIERMSALAAEALDTARSIAYRLRPFELDQVGLHSAIETLLADLCQGADLRVFKDLAELPELSAATQKLHLFRLMQEGLINVVRHARASTLLLEAKRQGSHVAIQIEDDGKGFDATASRPGRHCGLGLALMAEHAKALGGCLEVSSAPGRGTRLRIMVPAENLRKFDSTRSTPPM